MTLRQQDEGHIVSALPIQWRTQVTNLKLLSAALIATAIVATPAMARENRAAVKQDTATVCTRAPAVGAFATQPWVNPPCEPTAN